MRLILPVVVVVLLVAFAAVHAGAHETTVVAVERKDGPGVPPTGADEAWANETLTRELLTDFPNAVCNDGSPAGYYVITYPNQTSWVIVLEGSAGWCWDEDSCADFKEAHPDDVSSDSWLETMAYRGILSANRTSNPSFADYNKVIIPSCSSDLFTGNLSTAADDSVGFYFRGRQIFHDVILDLIARHDLETASYILLAGTVGGGPGVLANIEYLSEILPNPIITPPVIGGLLDSGWVLDIAPEVAGVTSQAAQFKAGVAYWNATAALNNTCGRTLPKNETFRCLMGQYALQGQMATIPIFVLQFSFDSFQLYSNADTRPPLNTTESTYATSMAEEFVGTLQVVLSPHLAFSASCYWSTATLSYVYETLQVTGQQVPEVVSAWFLGEDTTSVFDTCTTLDCNPSCPPINGTGSRGTTGA